LGKKNRKELHERLGHHGVHPQIDEGLCDAVWTRKHEYAPKDVFVAMDHLPQRKGGHHHCRCWFAVALTIAEHFPWHGYFGGGVLAVRDEYIVF